MEKKERGEGCKKRLGCLEKGEDESGEGEKAKRIGERERINRGRG